MREKIVKIHNEIRRYFFYPLEKRFTKKGEIICQIRRDLQSRHWNREMEF